MKIYTKTGDKGMTGLIGGSRVEKISPRIAAIGDIDELNAALGVVRTSLADKVLDGELEKVQNWLFDLGAEVASPVRMQHRAIGDKQSEFLENSMDRQTEQLPPLANFILPGGCPAAAHLHAARAICRRAERQVLALDVNEFVSDEAKVFLNRLSDWLFVAARTANAVEGVQDVKWAGTGE